MNDIMTKRAKQILRLGAGFFFVMGIVLKITDTSVRGNLVSKYGDTWHNSVVTSTSSFIFCAIFLLLLYFFYRKPKNKNSK
jgi:hypothetical protein